jgi:hypothetical protein
MGRGRAKAKQTKVARELKYSGPSTDLSALQKELSASGHPVPSAVDEVADAAADDETDEEFDDDYTAYLDDDE